MSHTALAWAFGLPVTGSKKAVLLAMAEHADDSGLCWPSVARLVLFSGIQERAVRNAIRDLETAKLVATEKSRGRITSQYRLAVGSVVEPETPPTRHYVPCSTRHLVPDGEDPTRHLVPANPASNAPNPASNTVNPASAAPEPLEPSRTLIEASKVVSANAPSVPSIPASAAPFVEAWNSMAERSGLPVIRGWSDDRGKKLKARIQASGPDAVFEAMGMVEASDFCTGRSGLFRADFDFLLQPKSFGRLIEGFYANRKAPKPARTSLDDAWDGLLNQVSRRDPTSLFDIESTADDITRSH